MCVSFVSAKVESKWYTQTGIGRTSKKVFTLSNNKSTWYTMAAPGFELGWVGVCNLLNECHKCGGRTSVFPFTLHSGMSLNLCEICGYMVT